MQSETKPQSRQSKMYSLMREFEAKFGVEPRYRPNEGIDQFNARVTAALELDKLPPDLAPITLPKGEIAD